MSTQVVTFCSSIMNQKKSDIFIAHFEQLTSLSLHLGAHHRVRHWEQSKVKDRGSHQVATFEYPAFEEDIGRDGKSPWLFKTSMRFHNTSPLTPPTLPKIKKTKPYLCFRAARRNLSQSGCFENNFSELYL